MYLPIQIANYFLEKSFDSGIEVTPMKLIKLVYIAHGWHLAIYDKPLIVEAVQAWKYGPVIKSVYHKFKKYGTEPIENLYLKFKEGEAEVPTINDEYVKLLLDKIWDEYGTKTAYELSNLTHQKGTPWFYIWNEEQAKHKKGTIIPNDLIEKHYLDKIDVSRERKEARATG